MEAVLPLHMPTDIAARGCSSSTCTFWHCCWRLFFLCTCLLTLLLEAVLLLHMPTDIATGGCSSSTHAYWHCCWRLFFLYTYLLTLLLEAVLPLHMPIDIATGGCSSYAHAYWHCCCHCCFYTCLLTLLLHKDCSSSADAHWHCCCMETVLPLYRCFLTLLLEAVLSLHMPILTWLLLEVVPLHMPTDILTGSCSSPTVHISDIAAAGVCLFVWASLLTGVVVWDCHRAEIVYSLISAHVRNSGCNRRTRGYSLILHRNMFTKMLRLNSYKYNMTT